MGTILANKVEVIKPEDGYYPDGITCDGNLRISDPVEGPSGPFTVLYKFGKFRDGREIPESERVTANTDPRVWYAAFDEKKRKGVTQAMREVTYVNAKSQPSDERARLAYQKALFEAFKPVAEQGADFIARKDILIFPPLNGGALMEAYLRQMGLVTENSLVAKVEVKRTKTSDGDWYGGIVGKESYPAGNIQVAGLAVVDDCLSRSVNGVTAMLRARERFPGITTIQFLFSAASQDGMDALLERGLGVGVLAAVPVSKTNEHGYLMRTKEEGYEDEVFTVGDMGKWAAALPRSFDEKAPWNRFR